MQEITGGPKFVIKHNLHDSQDLAKYLQDPKPSICKSFLLVFWRNNRLSSTQYHWKLARQFQDLDEDDNFDT